jgi:hypothetical protein
MLRDEPTPEELEACLGLTHEEIAQMVLLLLMQESAEKQLQGFLSRHEQSSPQPVQC